MTKTPRNVGPGSAPNDTATHAATLKPPAEPPEPCPDCGRTGAHLCQAYDPGDGWCPDYCVCCPEVPQ